MISVATTLYANISYCIFFIIANKQVRSQLMPKWPPEKYIRSLFLHLKIQVIPAWPYDITVSYVFWFATYACRSTSELRNQLPIFYGRWFFQFRFLDPALSTKFWRNLNTWDFDILLKLTNCKFVPSTKMQ